MSVVIYHASRGGVVLGRQSADIAPFAATLAPSQRLQAYSSSGAVLVDPAPLPQNVAFIAAWARGSNSIIQGRLA